MRKEYRRQRRSLELIASRKFYITKCWECYSVFTNKYSEGQVGAKIHGGCEHIDEEKHSVKKEHYQHLILIKKWNVNVQHIGVPSNGSIFRTFKTT